MLKQHIPAAPRIVERPPQRMAVIETVGDPDEVGGRAVGALYGAIAQLGLESGPLCARWPNASRAPKSEWVARWALPVPDHTPELGGGIVLETWYGRPTASGPAGSGRVRSRAAALVGTLRRGLPPPSRGEHFADLLLCDRRIDRIKGTLKLAFTPTAGDYEAIKLPPALWGAYYATRPCRLAFKAATGRT